MLGDPEQIRQVQRRLAADADHARWLARRVAQVGDVAWQAPAADAFRGRVADHVGALARCADDLEVAAGRVGVHARAVEAARAEVLRVAALGASLPEAVGGALRGGSRR